MLTVAKYRNMQKLGFMGKKASFGSALYICRSAETLMWENSNVDDGGNTPGVNRRRMAQRLMDRGGGQARQDGKKRNLVRIHGSYASYRKPKWENSMN